MGVFHRHQALVLRESHICAGNNGMLFELRIVMPRAIETVMCASAFQTRQR
jgi:hypothetical protein